MALKKSKAVVTEKAPKKSKNEMPPVEERKHTKDYIAEPSKAGLKEYSKVKALKAKIAELTEEFQGILQVIQGTFGRDQDTGFSFTDDAGEFTTILPRKGKWFVRGPLNYKPGKRPGPKLGTPSPKKGLSLEKTKPAKVKAEKKAPKAAAKPKKKLKKSKAVAE